MVGKTTLMDATHSGDAFDPAADAIYRAQAAAGCSRVLLEAMLPAIERQMRQLEAAIVEGTGKLVGPHAAELALALANARIQAQSCSEEAQRALATVKQRAEPLLASAKRATLNADQAALASGPGPADGNLAARQQGAPDAGASHVAAPASAATDPARIATRGVAGTGTALPYQQQIQTSFGQHDVSGIRAFVGGDAAEASATLGAEAFAIGDAVAFRAPPDLHTAAHEAAHVLQQRAGVQLAGGIDGGAGDVHEQHADAVADAVVRGHSAAALLSAMPRGGGAAAGALVQRKSSGSPTSAGPSGETKNAKAEGPPIDLLPGQTPVGFSLDIGSGVVTGSVGFTMAVGTAGVPIGSEHVKALKTEASIKLKDFATELETSVLSGDFDTEVLEGVTIGLKFSVGSVASNGGEVSTNLVTIGAELSGDVTQWFGVSSPGFSCTISGSVQIALGAKLAEKLTDLATKELEEQSFANDLKTAGTELAEHERQLAELEARRTALAAAGASREALTELEEKIFEHRFEAMARKEAMNELGERLLLSRKAAAGIAEKIQGVAARRVAKLMERESVKLVAEKIAHLVPYVSLAMYAIDAVQVIRKVRELIRVGHFGIPESLVSADGGHPAKDGDASDPSGPSSNHDTAPGNSSATDTPAGASHPSRGPGDTPQSGPPSSQDRDALEAAQRDLSPAARAILAAITQGGGGGSGVELTPADITKLGTLVPSDLTPDQIRQIVATLQGSGPRAPSGADVLREVERAVHAARGEPSTATADGTPADGGEGGAVTSPRQVEGRGGPVTSPGQVSGAKTEKSEHPRAIDDPQTIVESAPPQVIATWFVEKDGELVPSPEFERWKGDHRGAHWGDAQLADLFATTTRNGDGRWNLELAFRVYQGQRERRMRHHFFVQRGPASSLGAQANGLSFEPYAVVGK